MNIYTVYDKSHAVIICRFCSLLNSRPFIDQAQHGKIQDLSVEVHHHADTPVWYGTCAWGEILVCKGTNVLFQNQCFKDFRCIGQK